jgi:hypothetical protein
MAAAPAAQDLIATGLLSQHEAWAALRSYTRRRMYLAAVAAGEAGSGSTARLPARSHRQNLNGRKNNSTSSMPQQ